MSAREFFLRIWKLYRVTKSRPLMKTLLRYKVLAGMEHRHLSLSCVKTLIDIGAHKGQFSLAARHLAPGIKIISFEPLFDAAETYRKIFRTDKNTVLHQVAIGQKNGFQKMYISRRSDSSSLLPISFLQTSIFSGTEEVDNIHVKVGRLDEFVSPEQLISPAMLKIDVQGFEYEVLQGCESLLDSFEYVYCECSFVELYTGQRFAHEIITWLSDRGLVLAGIYNPFYDKKGKAIQADFLFSRKFPEIGVQ